MRIALALVTLAIVATASPAAAREPARLRLALLGDAPARAPSARLALPALDLAGADDAAPLLRVDDGAGARGGGADVMPALSLILGMIPGFGIGHLIANSPRWTTWLVVDIALLAVWVISSAFEPLDDGPFNTLLFVVVVVERVFQGIDAFKAAGGRLALDGSQGTPAYAFARPVADRAAGRFAAARF
jgi:hypothetical protein